MSARELYELQEIDLEADKANTEIKQITQKLASNSEVSEAKAKLAKEKVKLDGLLAQRKDLELEMEALETKLAESKSQLYGGKVTNSKELAAIQHNVEFLAVQKKEVEDKLMPVMESADNQQKMTQAAAGALKMKEAAWAEESVRLNARKIELVEQVQELSSSRVSAAEGIEKAQLAQYQRIRAAKQGIGVAKVERGMCTSCRLTLPARDVSRARNSAELVVCSSCGRILFVS